MSLIAILKLAKRVFRVGIFFILNKKINENYMD